MQRLTLIKLLHFDHHHKRKGLFKCQCGTEHIATVSLIKCNKILSCGCLKRQRMSELHTTHGHSSSKSDNRRGNATYRVWAGIIQRCLNVNNKNYKDYGGRGIAVDPIWRTYTTFLGDMGLRPSKAHSIDRIDNNGPYTKVNCRWTTLHTQSRNKRTNRLYTYNGETLTATDWAERIGITIETFRGRVKLRGVEFAITTPKLMYRGKNIKK